MKLNAVETRVFSDLCAVAVVGDGLPNVGPRHLARSYRHRRSTRNVHRLHRIDRRWQREEDVHHERRRDAKRLPGTVGVDAMAGPYGELFKTTKFTSIGGKGMTANISKKGVREIVGIHGTGISYQSKTAKWAKTPSSSNAPMPRLAKRVSPASVSAFVLVLAAVLWILAHWR
jgi:hypothetical protein